MSQFSIEKCLEHVDNIFELVLIGAIRARQISYGNPPKLPLDKTVKPTAASLEEIGKGLVDSSILNEEMPVYKGRNNLGFSTPGPLPPLSALGRQLHNKDDNEDSDLRNLDDSELGLMPSTSSQVD